MKKTIIVSLIFLLLTTIVFSSDEVGIRKRQLKELEDKLREIDTKIEINESQQNGLIDQMQDIESNIRKYDQQIKQLNNKIKTTKEEIKETEQKIVKEEKNLENKRDTLEKRIRIMYKSGQTGYIEVLLGSNNFKDLLTRIDMVQKIVEHDQNLIKDIKSKIEEIKNLKASLENKKASLENSKLVVEKKNKKLSNEVTQLRIKKNELKKNEKALKVLEDRLEQDANRVTQIIKNLESKKEYVGGEMLWPVPSSRKITSSFGNRIHPIYKTKKMHTGLDIGANWGKSIVASQSGTIIYADWLGTYGKAVMIDHGGDYVTLYGHLSSINVNTGQEVNVGQTIARCGTTGASTGPHLHFEVRVNGDYKDPMNFLKN
ncbi:MAG: murein hydrolase activator EnvC family protein [Bacillota bacterium]